MLPVNPVEATLKPFPQRAAKICILLPLVIVLWNAASRALAPQISFLSTPSGAILSAALCLVITVAGLTFGVIALLGVHRFGRKQILGRALIGMTINGLLLSILVTNFLAGRAKAQAQLDQLAQTRQAVQDLREGIKNDTSPNATSTHMEKLQKQVETAADKTTGPESAIMRANAVFLKQMQETSRTFEDASQRFEPEEILNLASSTTREALVAKRTATQDYIDANVGLRAFLEGGIEIFRAELVKQKLAPKDIELATASLHKGFGDKLPLLFRVRDSITDYASALLAVVNLLEENLGKWSYDEATEEFETEDEILRAKYISLLEKIDVAADEQNAAEELRQEMLSR